MGIVHVAFWPIIPVATHSVHIFLCGVQIIELLCIASARFEKWHANTQPITFSSGTWR